MQDDVKGRDAKLGEFRQEAEILGASLGEVDVALLLQVAELVVELQTDGIRWTPSA